MGQRLNALSTAPLHAAHVLRLLVRATGTSCTGFRSLGFRDSRDKVSSRHKPVIAPWPWCFEACGVRRFGLMFGDGLSISSYAVSTQYAKPTKKCLAEFFIETLHPCPNSHPGVIPPTESSTRRFLAVARVPDCCERIKLRTDRPWTNESAVKVFWVGGWVDSVTGKTGILRHG